MGCPHTLHPDSPNGSSLINNLKPGNYHPCNRLGNNFTNYPIDIFFLWILLAFTCCDSLVYPNLGYSSCLSLSFMTLMASYFVEWPSFWVPRYFFSGLGCGCAFLAGTHRSECPSRHFSSGEHLVGVSSAGVVTGVTWLRWCLPSFSTLKILFLVPPRKAGYKIQFMKFESRVPGRNQELRSGVAAHPLSPFSPTNSLISVCLCPLASFLCLSEELLFLTSSCTLRKMATPRWQPQGSVNLPPAHCYFWDPFPNSPRGSMW